MRIDATVSPGPPSPVAATLGSNRNPHGDVIAANSQYLTMNGKPWLPVMGEFHYSRYAESQWEPEILKMKAAGVSVISTYVIWIHHEQKEGDFNWSGQRDLRAFVELCGRHGIYVYPRIGPWAHAEVRNGGLPDWVLAHGPVRENDPIYLKEVDSFYSQIAQQLHGLLWKDGGPVIGLQIENEYGAKGPGKGAEHIRTLKKMAVDAGLDVPLYTVTGWDGAVIPLDSVLPVFGGYPDAPWDGSAKKLPPNEVYSFRFTNRSAGSMGAIGGNGQSAASSYDGTPFLTAEVGAGIEDTYFRRPVVSADDIAAIVPVMLGSGANLLGYYMFHGGRNPGGGNFTLQESQRTGYPTDVPARSYDFQAPIGEFGEERASLRKLKLVHYFLEDFGGQLAPMAPHAPAKLPANPSDLSVPRVAVRSLRNSGYIFLNNHIRGAEEHRFNGFQVELKLPQGTVRVPEEPIDLPAGSYGIWPVNLDLSGILLRYATAQLFKRVVTAERTYFFFFAIPGIAPEFFFPAGTHVVRTSAGVQQHELHDGIRLRVDPEATSTVGFAGGVTIVVLPETQAMNLWRGDDPGSMVSTSSMAYSDRSRWTLQNDGDAQFAFQIFGGKVPASGEDISLHSDGKTGVFRVYSVDVPRVELSLQVQQVQTAAPRKPFVFAPPLSWRPAPVPFAPEDKDFASAAEWKLNLPAIPKLSYLADVLLRLHYQGDVARLYRRTDLLDDNFWNGMAWEIGLGELGKSFSSPELLNLRVLPLPLHFAMYLEHASELRFDGGQAVGLSKAELIPRYQVRFDLSAR